MLGRPEWWRRRHPVASEGTAGRLCEEAARPLTAARWSDPHIVHVCTAREGPGSGCVGISYVGERRKTTRNALSRFCEASENGETLGDGSQQAEL